MCHRELGPGTEYGLLLVRVPCHRSALLKGSDNLKAVLTLSRDTCSPADLRYPHVIVSPISGNSERRVRTLASSSVLVTNPEGSDNMLYSERLR